jgi:23S rRNA (cytidine1920-2'-O)/16S rRNA (cytidine1409-2'-O)-methyltransferase
MEHVNARTLTAGMFSEQPTLAVMDVSFISIRLVLPAVKALLKPGADYICLIKPQFEAGREEVGKKGVVRDQKVHCGVIRKIRDLCREQGFSVLGLTYSPIRGPEGNIEYLIWIENQQNREREISAEDPEIASLVAEAHENLDK